MATNQRFDRLFLRVDGNNKIIAGSGVLRKSKPKVGKWIEDPAYACCGTTTSSTTTTTTSTSTSTTTSTTTTSPSDFRLKVNIRPTGNKVGQFTEYSWEWNSTAISLGLDHYSKKGVIAQEVLEVMPEAISIAEDGFYRVDYSKIV